TVATHEAARANSLLAVYFGPIFNEANEPSSACRLWRTFQVETSTPPANHNIAEVAAEVKSGSRQSRSSHYPTREPIASRGRDVRAPKAAAILPQNKLLMMIPSTLRGPWSSKPSVALSSFCRLSLAFFRNDSSLISLPTLLLPRLIFSRISRAWSIVRWVSVESA